MKILITGGCGFLGSNLSKEALSKSFDLTVFDNLSRDGSRDNLTWLKSLGEFRFVNGDIRNQNDVESLIASVKPDVIFHLAGQVAMTTSIENPRKDFEINALGSFNLLESVRKYSKESLIIYSSTNKVYGDLEWLEYEERDSRYVVNSLPNGFDESTPLSFASPYGTSKGSADQYMLDYAKIFGLKTVVLRHSSMYGGRQFATYDQGWIGWFCQKALDVKNGQGEQFTISGNGKQVRDVLHASDMVCLYYGLIDHLDAVCGQAFNIGGGMANSLSLLELFDFLEEELDVKLDYRKIEVRASDQKIFVADLSKIQKATKWLPKMSKQDGLRDMLDWLRK